MKNLHLRDSVHAFLNALSPLLHHPDPTAAGGDLQANLESKPALPSLSSLYSHFPLLKALIFGLGKTFSPLLLVFADLGLIALFTSNLFDATPTPTPNKAKTKATSFLITTAVLATLVMRFDDAFLIEFGSIVLTKVLATHVLLALAYFGSFKLNYKNAVLAFIVLVLVTSGGFPLSATESLSSSSSSSPSKDLYNYEVFSNQQNPECRNGDTIAGTYIHSTAPLAHKVFSNWAASTRTYDETVATPWLFTGDSRTLIPFTLTSVAAPVNGYARRWVEMEDGEAVAVDCAFPDGGFSNEDGRKVYLVLHGLNGGSSEEYVKDLVNRRVKEKDTVCVMIARGLMETPIVNKNIFHGARVTDVHTVAKAIRKAMPANQMLVGAGYSMGAIVLSNYVARYGDAVEFDVAISVGGGIDMRFNIHNKRSSWLWQPFLAQTLRANFYYRFFDIIQERLSEEEMFLVKHSPDVTGIDTHMVAPYNGFSGVEHYYQEMSAASDFVSVGSRETEGRIADVSIPLAIISSLDDPLICEKTLLNPAQIVETGSGNIFFVLTKTGGHVGFPVGADPRFGQWKWMSEAIAGFADAVEKTKRG